ncbi:hypothetical protein C475_13792 [Halosimplex carlsbadense 2-9-1]|uniref:DUF2110 domain-containing protein n=1 Tax=Halosimplex carlsbadense 2-9-1 TaxID=797114 RepID=M0CM50_9EURY|nr:DUF2110 family protein [Halosimplex carlsbadense]ELZ24326.1 hypothetical protein C475_13792 [Halosimplex carlsbadense 2-9-1]
MVVLATKLYVEGDARSRATDSLRSQVNNVVGDLDVTVDLEIRGDEFPEVTLDGEDATVAANALAEEWGEVAPEIEPGAEHVGTLESWDDEGFVLDAGFGRDVRIPAGEIGLGQGTPEQIRTRFGLVQHLPMRFVAADPEEDEPARLADAERDRLYEWTRGAGRVNVNSATRAEARATVNRAGHAQDIVTVERLGLLEQSIVCTEDTDPPGLLASIGQYMSAELLCVVP